MQKLTFVLCCFASLTLSGQSVSHSDPVLFSVGKLEVPVSEFQYIYTKNNRDQADYSSASVNEYLELYIRFKLKVMRARELQLDTIAALQQELAGYRKQLAKSYLQDKEVMHRLTREAYNRMQEDIQVAHILFRVPADSSPEDMQAIHERASAAALRARDGEDFAALAEELSDDANTAGNGGVLGYLTALLPNGFYALESAIYALREGEISDPVRSPLGYHVVTVLGRRPARGEIEAGHILVRVKEDESNSEVAKQKIDAVYESIKSGASTFEEMAANISDDQQTARRNGYIGRFGINAYDPVFEDAAFALVNEGDISTPVQTRVGWHIIRLIRKHKPGTFEEARPRIEARLGSDERVKTAQSAMITKIKKESGLAIDTQAVAAYIDSLGEDFLTFQWAAPPAEPAMPLIRFEDGVYYTTEDFTQFLRLRTRERMRGANVRTPQEVASELFDEWIDEQCLAYEEQRLEDKYPDFRALMREYEEGILLFEVTKMKVWDKASQDTAGLATFHAEHRYNYMWPERADVLHLTVTGPRIEKIAARAAKQLSRSPVESVVQKINRKEQQITYSKKRYTREETEREGWLWQEGWTSPMTQNAAGSTIEFLRIAALLPPEPRALSESRGYVIADYQDHLEKQWVEELRQKYPVVVNEPVLHSIIR